MILSLFFCCCSFSCILLQRPFLSASSNINLSHCVCAWDGSGEESCRRIVSCIKANEGSDIRDRKVNEMTDGLKWKCAARYPKKTRKGLTGNFSCVSGCFMTEFALGVLIKTRFEGCRPTQQKLVLWAETRGKASYDLRKIHVQAMQIQLACHGFSR